MKQRCRKGEGKVGALTTSEPTPTTTPFIGVEGGGVGEIANRWGCVRLFAVAGCRSARRRNKRSRVSGRMHSGPQVSARGALYRRQLARAHARETSATHWKSGANWLHLEFQRFAIVPLILICNQLVSWHYTRRWFCCRSVVSNF
jgi:hypothetical protein